MDVTESANSTVAVKINNTKRKSYMKWPKLTTHTINRGGWSWMCRCVSRHVWVVIRSGLPRKSTVP